MKINLLFISFLILSSCMVSPVTGKHKAKVFAKKQVIKYNFSQPDSTFILDGSLVEISGLSYYPQANTLLAVNDEDGFYFELDSKTGEIIGELEFHNAGDYEGIEIVGEDMFIVKSNGKIYQVSSNQTEVFKTPLSSANDVEGLGCDKENHQLLVACKGQTLDPEESKSSKGVYAFSLRKMKLKKDPYLLIKRKKTTEFLKDKEASEKVIARSKHFAPSGIAVHPINHHIYILSARGGMMLVFNQEHKLVQAVFFDKDKVPQPEGICFSPKGTLFISTEGQGRSGKIFVFDPVK